MRELFSDVNGKVSAKRVFGFIATVTAIFTTFFVQDAVLVGVWVTSATAAFGLSIGERKAG